MASMKRLRHAVHALGLAGAVLASGCVAAPRAPTPAMGDMPRDATWAGVYRTPQGYLHLTKQGDRIAGAWRVPPGVTYGRLLGSAKGNVLEYQWVEYEPEGSVAQRRLGRGYFVYSVPGAGAAAELVGQRGSSSSDMESWHGVKRADIRPNLAFASPGTDGERYADWADEDEGFEYDNVVDQP